MESQTKMIRLDLLKICWYMRGGVTYSEASSMSPEERTIVAVSYTHLTLPTKA